MTNENHWVFFKTKANEQHCQKKDNDQNNSPRLKSARGRSLDILLVSFTFTLFHNNNNWKNLSKPYSKKKSILKEKTKKHLHSLKQRGGFFPNKSLLQSIYYHEFTLKKYSLLITMLRATCNIYRATNGIQKIATQPI